MVHRSPTVTFSCQYISNSWSVWRSGICGSQAVTCRILSAEPKCNGISDLRCSSGCERSSILTCARSAITLAIVLMATALPLQMLYASPGRPCCNSSQYARTTSLTSEKSLPLQHFQHRLPLDKVHQRFLQPTLLAASRRTLLIVRDPYG